MAKRIINLENGNKVTFDNVKNVKISNMDITRHNGIISARNIDDMTAENACDRAKKYLENMDNQLFNAVVLCGYAVGIRIPAYTEASGRKVDGLFIEKPIKAIRMAELIGKDRGTVSKWIKALNYIIDNGMFPAFAQGMFPFSVEKIIAYYEKLKGFGFTLKQVMGWSTADIRNMIKEKTATATAKQLVKLENAGINTDLLEDTPAPAEKPAKAVEVTFIYKGTTYTVDESVMENFIKNNAKNTLTA